ncbi:rRNA pseudouridine synthase [Candidatus Gracilibacteria bacterium]|nr:MAG: rRNA pseudouridine synthase [Candidatus Gracilibacteria bacterium]
MRIDKFLANLGLITRKDAKKIFKLGNIFINGEAIFNESQKINFGDEISFFDEIFNYKENYFLILNKPVDFVSSRVSEGGYPSVYDVIFDYPYQNLIEIVGRLDVDTTGLLLFTNNGKIIHKLINPKKNIFKKYLVKISKNLSEKDIEKLETGVIIDGNYRTKPAKVNILGEKKIELLIQEGKFHQIKKMLLAVENEVLELHRTQIGEIKIGDLEIGKYRELSQEEINYLENL